MAVPGATVVRVDGARQWLRFDRHATTAAALVSAVAAAADLVDLAVEEPDIEDMVARIYREGQRRLAGNRHGTPDGTVLERPCRTVGSVRSFVLRSSTTSFETVGWWVGWSTWSRAPRPSCATSRSC